MANPYTRLARQLEEVRGQVRALASTPQLAYSSIENGSVDEYDGEGNLVQIIGRQWDGTHGAYPVTGPVPPRPTAPVLTGGLGLTIGWDGTFADDAGEQDITITAPMDWSRVELHVSKVSGFTADTADTLVDSIESPRGGSRPALVEPGTWYAVLVSRSLTGKRSVQSAESTAVVTPPVGSDIDLEKLEEERKAAEAELQRQINENRIKQGELAGTVTELQETTLPTLAGDLASTQERLAAIPRTVEQAQDAAVEAKRLADAAVTDAGTAQKKADDAALAAREAAGLAGTKGKTLFQSTAPAAEDRNAMTLWIDTTNSGNVPKRWTTGTTWVAVQDKTAVDAASKAGQAVTDAAAAKKAADAAQAAADAAAVRIDPLESAMTTLQKTTIPALQTSIDGKTRIARSTGDAPTSVAGYLEGDRWEKWSTLSAGGKLLKTWRVRGTVWTQELMDPAYLPQVDIGAGTFGDLAGGRIQVGTLGAQHVLIGASGNLIPNGSGEWMRAGAWSESLTWDTTDKPDGQSGAFKGKAFQQNSTWFDVEPSTEYKFELWVKADKPDSVFYLELRDQAGALAGPCKAIPGQTSGAYGNYPVGNYTVPTTWTKLTAVVTTTATASRVRVGALYFNHTNGTERDATVSLAGLRLVRRTEGSLVVENSITAREVNGESVAGAVGSFIQLGVEQLVVTKAGKFNDLVAKQIAADSGKYLSLSTDQLVAGTANIDTGVANTLYAGIFASNKIYGTQVVLGSPSNMMPDPGFNDAEMTKRRNTVSTCTVSISSANDLTLTNSSTGLLYLRPYGTAQTQAAALAGQWIPVAPGDVYLFTFQASAWKAATGWAQLLGRSKDGATTYNIGRTTIAAGGSTVTVEATIPPNCYWVIPEVAVPAGGASYILRNTMSLVQKITPALIVAGLMDAQRVVGASIESNAAANRGVKLTDAGLFAFNSSGVETVRLDGANSILTGATIRTAASGARWQMSSAGLEAWNAEGKRYLLGNASGLEMVGTVTSEGDTRDTTATTSQPEFKTRVTMGRRRLLEAALDTNPGLWFEGEPLDGSDAPFILPAGLYGSDGFSEALTLRSARDRQIQPLGTIEVGPGRTFLSADGERTNGWQQSSNFFMSSGSLTYTAKEWSGLPGTQTVESFRFRQGGRFPKVPAEVYSLTGIDLSTGTGTTVRINGRNQEYIASTRVSLSNGFLHHAGSGWDGLRYTVSGDVVEITGAYERSSAWAGGTVIATLPASLRPSASKQGQGMSINSAGQIMADAGQGPKSGFVVYIRA